MNTKNTQKKKYNITQKVKRMINTEPINIQRVNAGAHERQAVLHLKLTQSPLISRLNAGQVLTNGKQFST